MTKKNKILVVDDELDILDILKSDLENQNYYVYTALTIKEALKTLENEKCDLIICDFRLVNSSGLDLLNQIKKINASEPGFILVTGNDDSGMDEIFALGADAVFLKPWDCDQLSNKIKSLLQIPRDRWTPRQRMETNNNIVQLKCASFDSGLIAKIINVGRGGMFIAMDDQFPALGGKISFSFDNATIVGNAIVRWVRRKSSSGLPSGIGVEFIELNEEQITAILALIKKMNPVAYIPRVHQGS